MCHTTRNIDFKTALSVTQNLSDVGENNFNYFKQAIFKKHNNAKSKY